MFWVPIVEKPFQSFFDPDPKQSALGSEGSYIVHRIVDPLKAPLRSTKMSRIFNTKWFDQFFFLAFLIKKSQYLNVIWHLLLMNIPWNFKELKRLVCLVNTHFSTVSIKIKICKWCEKVLPIAFLISFPSLSPWNSVRLKPATASLPSVKLWPWVRLTSEQVTTDYNKT